MSKTFTYVLFVIGAYILFIFPKATKNQTEKEGLTEEEQNKVKEGADTVKEGATSISAGYTT